MEMKTHVASRMTAGDVFYGLQGDSPSEVFASLLSRCELPEGLDAAVLQKALLEREDLASTGVGHGIAFPHPRNPLLKNPDAERIFVAFLHKSIDFGALDQKLVTVLFVVLSASIKNHLETISRLSFLCKSADFRARLEAGCSKERLLEYVLAEELLWEREQ
jgi:PTS system nitrogen regulatory IIA component